MVDDRCWNPELGARDLAAIKGIEGQIVQQELQAFGELASPRTEIAGPRLGFPK